MISNVKSTRFKILDIAICILVIAVVTLFCFFINIQLSYRSDALILLLTVSVLAMFYDMIPVLIAATLSALAWNFLFIPPIFTFHIGTAEDGLMFLMYFVIALLNVVLVSQIKKEQKKLRKKEEEAMVIKLYNTVLNSLSHELKTPISTIIGSVDMIESDEVTLSESQRKELIHEMGLAGQRLNRQINNLLQMSRLDSGILQAKLDWVDLEELIYKIIYELKAENRVSIKARKPLPLIKTDEYWLEVMLHNFILNALNYSISDSPIYVEIPKIEHEVRIVVSDNGPGIDELDKLRIFDKFYRSSGSSIQGSGLGLSIVKGYAEALKGQVGVLSNERGGSNFFLILPVETTFVNQLNHD